MAILSCSSKTQKRVTFSVSPNYGLSNLGSVVAVWELSSGTRIRTLAKHSDNITSIAISPDGSTVLTGSEDETMKLTDFVTGNEIRTFRGHSREVLAVAYSPDGKFVLSGSDDLSMRLWDISTGNSIRTFGNHDRSVKSVAFSPDGKYVLSSTGKYLEAYNTAHQGKSWEIKLWDVSTGKVVRSFDGHSDGVPTVVFSPNGKHFLSGSYDGTMRLWDIATGQWTSFLSNDEDSEWLAWTSDGFWDSSPNGGELVAMVQGMNCWNIDQFAVKNNRPDIILQRIGSTDKDLIDHYFAQYQKRLRKLGLKEDQTINDYYVPLAKISEAKQRDKFLDLQFSLSDQKYNLKRYNIYVNDIPLFGSYGKEIKGKSLDLSASVELISGDNKIEISCMNEKGVESYRALTYAKYDKPVKGDLYFLGFGVSKYKNTALNLEYADKDANDLAAAFNKMKGGKFANVYIKTYTNEQVLPDSIAAAKKFLKNAKPDDTFVLFIAGHGMHDKDKEATYYFLTHNADPENLKNTAADFESIEDLLQGVAPRNKLFLMDACESGEIEENEQTNFTALAGARGLKSRGIKLVKTSDAAQQISPRTFLSKQDRFIYNDLSRRSGTIVFSSSKGGEFSYESSEIQNGLFTHSIITALSGSLADKNADGITSTDELREYVSREVAKTSKDLQHPTVDRDNIYQKFGFGLK